MSTERSPGVWYVHGATVYRLKEVEGRGKHNWSAPGVRALENDTLIQISGSDAGGIAARVHQALASPRADSDERTAGEVEIIPSKNPFRNSVMRRAYDEAVAAYTLRSNALFHEGQPSTGNGVAGPFWRGFRGEQAGSWDAASKQTIAYAYWRAGQDVMAATPAQPAGAVPDGLREVLLLAKAALNAATDALDGAAKREKVPDRSLKLLSTSQDCVYAASAIRERLASHPAVQSAGSGALERQVSQERRELVRLSNDLRGQGHLIDAENIRKALADIEQLEESCQGNASLATELRRRLDAAPDSTRTGQGEAEGFVLMPVEPTDKMYDDTFPWVASNRFNFGEMYRALLAARPAAPEEISVDIQRMRLSDNRTDYYVRVKCGERETTPFVFRDRYKAEHEADHFRWIFGLREEQPDVMAYDETSHPND